MSKLNFETLLEAGVHFGHLKRKWNPAMAPYIFEEKKGTTMAAIKFGGWASDERIEEFKKRLSDALLKEGISHSGKFMYLGYDPPYAVVGRRNEVVVELSSFKM